MGRAPCCEKVGLKRGRWTAEEDEILVNYIRVNGEGSWRSLPKNAGLLRCGKSCRLRWINYLRADVKRGNISKEEDETITKLHASVGNRWSLIASHLPGRTDNEIKNYWNSHLGRRVYSFQRIGGDGTPAVVDLSKFTCGGKRRGGRTSRSAMKKNLNGVSIRREKQEKVGVLPTSSSVRSAEGSSMLLDLDRHQANSLTLEGLDTGILGLNKETETGLLSPSQFVDGGLWDEVEGGLFGASDDSLGWGSHEGEERGDVSINKEREDEILVLNKGRNDGPLALKESRVVALGEEEVVSAQADKMLDWDLEGMEVELWDEVGEMWPWVWDNRNGELELQGMEGGGYQEEPFDTWFLSDVF